MATTAYGDITPRTAALAARELLTRAQPYLVFEDFGQSKPLPGNKSKVMKFRRYNALAFTPNALSEGVTPDAKQLTVTDVTATLVQYGDRITITDVIMDTHEDPVFSEAQDIISEQSAQMIETVRYGVLKAGTNKVYANGSARTDVNTPITLTVQRKVTRALKEQNAKPITKAVKAGPDFGTRPVAKAFVGVCHPNLEADLRGLAGFTPVEEYSGITPYENEIGKVEDCRYVTTTLATPWADGGAAKAGSGTTMLSTTGTSADVYPILYFGQDAYGIIALKGAFAITPMVVNPKPSDSDPLGQRGHVSWKSMQTAVILNDLWMCRAEVAVTAL